MANDSVATNDTADAEVIRKDKALRGKNTTTVENSASPPQAGIPASTQPGEQASLGSVGGPVSAVKADAAPTAAIAASAANSAPSGTPQPAVQTIPVSVTVGGLTHDAEVAGQTIKNDVAKLHTLIANVAHYSALPFEEIYGLLASIQAHLGVAHSKAK